MRSPAIALSLILICLPLPVMASGPSTESTVTIPQAYHINSLTATDASGQHLESRDGDLTTLRSQDGSEYMWIPIFSSGSVVESFDADGISFRNNTTVFRLTDSSGRDCSLAVATEGLIATGNGAYARVTGSALEMPELSSGNSRSSALLYLKELPAGESFREAYISDDAITRAVMDLADAYNDTYRYADVELEVSGAGQDANYSIDFIITTMSCNGTGAVYLYRDGEAKKVAFAAIDGGDGSIAYRAAANTSCAFVLAGNEDLIVNQEGLFSGDMAFTAGTVSVLCLLAIVLSYMVMKVRRDRKND
jgi:hypothetical protein